MSFPPYPLAWPDGLPRTERKASSQFRTSLSAAINNVKKSLAAFGSDTGKAVSEVAVTSNVAGIAFEPPKDTGVAVWFEWEGAQRCIAVDRYPKVEDNLQAIHHILEARRTEMRHGGLHIVRQTFKGFVALPTRRCKAVARSAGPGWPGDCQGHRCSLPRQGAGGTP